MSIKWDIVRLQDLINEDRRHANTLPEEQRKRELKRIDRAQESLNNIRNEYERREVLEDQFVEKMENLARQAPWLFNHPTETE